MASERTIGVFDSGVGGLSVLRELKHCLPNENYRYLGDSARNPYGPKSTATVITYTLEAVDFLAHAGAKLVVIACNTATAAGLEAAREAFPDIPVIGVVEPGCLAAAEATRNGHVALIATKGTVASGAHAARLRALRPDSRVTGIAAPIFVTLAEEGWLHGPVPDAVAERYLSDVFSGPEEGRPDCLILGCTHFLLLWDSIRKAVGESVTLVDPAVVTAAHARKTLEGKDMLRESASPGKTEYYVTAEPDRFVAVGNQFLRVSLPREDIHCITLG